MGLVLVSAVPGVGAHGTDEETDESLESFIIQFSENTDLTGAYTISDPLERTKFVVDRLRNTAELSQAEALEMVRDGGYQFESLWISNDLWVHTTRSEIDRLARLPGVSRVLVESETSDEGMVGEAVQPPSSGPLWNIQATGAPTSWSSGFDGSGIVVASLDTGVDADHPALSGAWRHEGGWVDTTGANACDKPCDLNGHGTHTTGTILGFGPGGEAIGVAPGARFIAARVCDEACELSEVMRGIQWLLAPTNENGEPDPSLRPDVINASWTREKLDVSLSESLSVLDAAGIEVVFAVGNSGPACGSNSAPGEMSQVFAVGSVDRMGTVTISSGRGPTSHGGTNPQVVAPGDQIVSARAGGGYTVLSGTSMAAPHVTGAFALILSAHPHLRGSGLIAGIIEKSAEPVIDNECGPGPNSVPNNVYGFGRLNIGKALLLAAELDS